MKLELPSCSHTTCLQSPQLCSPPPVAVVGLVEDSLQEREQLPLPDKLREGVCQGTRSRCLDAGEVDTLKCFPQHPSHVHNCSVRRRWAVYNPEARLAEQHVPQERAHYAQL